MTNPIRLDILSPSRIDVQPYNQGCTIGEWMGWRKASSSLQSLALYSWTFNFLILPDGSQSLEGMYVTKDYFNVLGLRPVLGREFVEGEAAHPNSGPTAIILGYHVW